MLRLPLVVTTVIDRPAPVVVTPIACARLAGPVADTATAPIVRAPAFLKLRLDAPLSAAARIATLFAGCASVTSPPDDTSFRLPAMIFVFGRCPMVVVADSCTVPALPATPAPPPEAPPEAVMSSTV